MNNNDYAVTRDLFPKGSTGQSYEDECNKTGYAIPFTQLIQVRLETTICKNS